ncbi:hypothetical protein BMT54_10350 [Pasteurellaceae bacterium 15-036681]|nr:hypothetical protein BMT54_10350 [Pasteurellaceae bacterium 15-036681]
MNWFWIVLKKSFDFKGRARRREYGWFNLIYFIISFILSFFAGASASLGLLELATGLELVDNLFGLVTFFAMISVTTRRLHDLGYSGWWQLLPIVVIIGTVITAGISAMGMQSMPDDFSFLVSGGIGIIFIAEIIAIFGFYLWLFFKDGQRFSNKYGVDPKSPEEVEVPAVAETAATPQLETNDVWKGKSDNNNIVQ